MPQVQERIVWFIKPVLVNKVSNVAGKMSLGIFWYSLRYSLSCWYCYSDGYSNSENNLCSLCEDSSDLYVSWMFTTILFWTFSRTSNKNSINYRIIMITFDNESMISKSIQLNILLLNKSTNGNEIRSIKSIDKQNNVEDDSCTIRIHFFLK